MDRLLVRHIRYYLGNKIYKQLFRIRRLFRGGYTELLQLSLQIVCALICYVRYVIVQVLLYRQFDDVYVWLPVCSSC